MQGKITLPVAKAMSRLPQDERAWLWETLQSKPHDQRVVARSWRSSKRAARSRRARSRRARSSRGLAAAEPRRDSLSE